MIKTEQFDANIINNRKFDMSGIEDKVFPTTFLVLKVAGIWTPTTIKLRPIRLCYKIYTLFCFISVVMLIVSILLDNILSDKSLLSFLEYWYMVVIFSNGVMKIINLLMRRSRVIHIMRKRIMEERWIIPRDKEEAVILRESRHSEK